MMSRLFGLWYLSPFDCLKVIGVILAVTLIARQTFNGFWNCFGVQLLFSIGSISRRSGNLVPVDLRQNQEEITQRIYKGIHLPIGQFALLFRRLGYNNIFGVQKDAMKCPFWDLRRVFQ